MDLGKYKEVPKMHVGTTFAGFARAHGASMETVTTMVEIILKKRKGKKIMLVQARVKTTGSFTTTNVLRHTRLP